jgi:AraC-like DNA-binding protein
VAFGEGDGLLCKLIQNGSIVLIGLGHEIDLKGINRGLLTLRGLFIAFKGHNFLRSCFVAILDAKETRRRIRSLGLEQKSQRCFSLRERSVHLAYDWHSHSRHLLLYSLSGRIILRSRQARWLLPPQRAAWIPAGIKHQTTLDRAETVSIFFKSVPRGFQVDDIRIIRANSLLREMLLYSLRWPAQGELSKRDGTLQKSFFQALAHLCLDWIHQELPFRLPVPKDAAVMKAVQHLFDHLDSASVKSAAQASLQSVRTLRRRFLPDTGFTWQQYALHARLLQAMDALLSTRKSVIEVAYSVGYDSPSAFAKAFSKFTGASPLAFRKSRVNFHGSGSTVISIPP